MKSTGEAMGIGRTFGAALVKAMRGLDLGRETLTGTPLESWSDDELESVLAQPTHERLFAVAESLRRGALLTDLARITTIDPFWLHEIAELTQLEERLRTQATAEDLRAALDLGYSQRSLAVLTDRNENVSLWNQARVVESTAEHARSVAFRMVDTAAAEFPARSPYYYLSRGEQDEMRAPKRDAVVVVGSGPIRIGQGIEFDYSCVHAAWSLQAAGRAAVVINNNPETVSTDFDISDVLAFEPPAPTRCRPRTTRPVRSASCWRSAARPRSISRPNSRAPRRADHRQRPPLRRGRGGPRQVRRAAGAARRRASAGPRGEELPRGARHRTRTRLPRAGAAVVRARRPGHGDRLQRGPTGGVRGVGAADPVVRAAARRQVPARPRGRGRLRVRRRGHPRAGRVRAHRAGRHPLGRLDQRVSAADDRRRDATADRRHRALDRRGSRHARTDQHSVRDPRRHGVHHRGESARESHGTDHLEGHRHQSRWPRRPVWRSANVCATCRTGRGCSPTRPSSSSKSRCFRSAR